MPTGIYKHKPCSEETKKRISKAQSKEKGHWFGRIFSEETRYKMSKAHKGKPSSRKGYILTEEHKRKIGKANKGKICSEETKVKLSKVMIGRKCSQKTKDKMSEIMRGKYKGEKAYWFGKKLPEEMRMKISKAHKGKTTWNKGKIGIYSEETKRKISEAQKGNKGSNWQGGKSFETYTVRFNKELKELIRNRDNYKCQLCGMPECENIRKLDIHHKDYNKKNCLPNNLISLCRGCHIKTNINREYWMEYFKLKGF